MRELSEEYRRSREQYVEAVSLLPEQEREEAMRRLDELDARMYGLPSGRFTALGAGAAGLLAAIVLVLLVIH